MRVKDERGISGLSSDVMKSFNINTCDANVLTLNTFNSFTVFLSGVLTSNLLIEQCVYRHCHTVPRITPIFEALREFWELCF